MEKNVIPESTDNQKKGKQNFDLKKAKAELESFFNGIPELVCIASRDGYFKKLNPVWEKVLGFSVKELMSKPFIDFIHPDDKHATLNEIEKQLNGKKTIHFKNRFLSKTGEYKTFDWFATPSPDQNLLFAAARDISESIDKDKELIASEEKYRLFFENSMDAILITTSPDGRILSANKAACKMFNYTESEIMQLNRTGLVDITDPRLPILLNERAITGKARGNLRFIKKGGIKFETEVTSTTIIDNNGVTRNTIIVHDITDRLKAEEALKQSESRYKSLFDNSGTNIIIIDKDGIYQMINTNAAENFGKKPEEVVGKSMFEFFPEELAQKYLEFNMQLLEKGGKREYEDTFELATGVKTFLIVDQCLQDRNGNNIAIQSSSIDVSHRKQAEEALHKSEELLRSVLNNAPITIFATDKNGVFTLSEGRQLKSVDLKPGENVGVSAIELFGTMLFEESSGNFTTGADLIYRVLKGETIIAYNELKGVFFENHLAPIYSKDHKITGMLGVATDITERKITENELRRSESKYKNLFESSLIGISSTDFNGQLIQANQAYAQMYGFDSAEQMLAEAPDIRIRYAHPEKRAEILKILTEKGRIGPVETEVLKRDGTKITVLVTAHVIKDNNGNILYTQAEHIDISEQKKLQEELVKSRKEMLDLSLHIEKEREAERAKIAMDLHDDLGQKLTALIMDVAWLKRKIPDETAEVSDKLNSISLLLNETLIDIQNIAGGLRPIILDDLGLSAAVHWLIRKFNENTGLHFTLSIVPGDLSLSSDLSTIVYRIVQEGITNIARHAYATSCIVTIVKKHDFIIINIKDNGIGITEMQVKSAVSFGLIGIRERIKILGGSFRIKGDKNLGTELAVKIPIKQQND
jgi:PAS domain S-box-containing protein